MFESLDILYIVLAFCSLWLTAFFCWLMWQIAMMLKNVNDTMSEAREKIAKIEQALTAIKNRCEKATAGFGLLGEGVKKLVEYVVEKKRARKKEEEKER
jgi:hypothetical protein